MNAVQAKDYVATISSLDPELPNADTLFWRLVCPLRPDIAGKQKSREKEHRGCGGADKKEAIHHSD